MNKPVIVSGEASETDSEDEINAVCETGQMMTTQIKGQEVIGEDSESENENHSKSIVSILSDSHTVAEAKQNDRNPSLLHQKLCETNSRFYDNLENFIKNVIIDSEKSLTEVDQHILKSQLVVQGAVTSLKNLNQQTNTLKNKLHTLLSSNFLSNVKIT